MAKETCIHCGAEAKKMIYQNDQAFCCEGCILVYNILQENSLYDYYDIQDKPGIKDNSPKESYAYLDHEEIKNSVLDFHDGNNCKINLYVPAIHCSSCIWLLENLERLHSGVISSMVNFTKKKVTVNYNESKLKLSELMGILESIHYKAYITKEKNTVSKNESKKVIIKLGIAGFAFGNVMLLSFPEYLSDDIILNSGLINSFGWISILLSLPVLLYSASDYFQSAWKNLLKKIISIDLPIAVGIIAIFARSLFEIFTKSGAGYLDSLTGLVFFLLIGKWYQAKTYDALNFENDYTSYFPLGILKVENDEEAIVPIDQLEKGDIIRVKNSEIIPADALLQSESTAVNYSFITGESVPVTKNQNNLIYAGGRVIGKSIVLKVEKKVEASYLASMWKERGKNQSSVLSHTLNSVSKYFTIAVLLLSGATAIYWSIFDPSKTLFAFTSVLIVACPCALALSIPFAFGHGRTFLGKKGFYLKKAEVIENLKSINTIVFDKTGTLTNPNSFEVDFKAIDTTPNFELIKSLAKQSNHPLSRAIYQYLAQYNEIEVEEYDEIPGQGLQGKHLKSHIKMGSSNYVGIDRKESSDAALVHVKVNNEYVGFFCIRNHYREGWQNLLNSLSMHFDVHLLSGDNDKERAVLSEYISNNNMHFNQSPKDKLHYIKALQQNHKNVLMVGDGLNDAGALQESNTGISVADNIYLFAPSSDAIINAKSLHQLPTFLNFTQKNMKVVYASFVLSFLYNLIGIYFAASGQLAPIIAAILMPLSSITVVAFTSLTTLFISRRIKF
ncbi:MAG: heavy metal translocating P-type ATPase metal-binding domain-containing protein [Prolixibacteraceae bacterium]|jgi:Cu+-exporting ATPase|nr:heavy metal translocating P-type ATPase metal-binding domain-containing protein [Prolixibacteraceae bacterium]